MNNVGNQPTNSSLIHRRRSPAPFYLDYCLRGHYELNIKYLFIIFYQILCLTNVRFIAVPNQKLLFFLPLKEGFMVINSPHKALICSLMVTDIGARYQGI
jgi:hypothetical protein